MAAKFSSSIYSQNFYSARRLNGLTPMRYEEMMAHPILPMKKGPGRKPWKHELPSEPVRIKPE
jgi:hypothetical protein